MEAGLMKEFFLIRCRRGTRDPVVVPNRPVPNRQDSISLLRRWKVC